MQIKVQCPCEARYAFEVEPLNGRMPVRVNCPTCGADGTEAANALIRQQLEATPSSAPVPAPVPAPARQPVRISGSVPAPAPVTPPAAMPVADADQESGAAPGAAAVPAVFCPKHRQEPATGSCCICGKAICPQCMQQFGYVCSVYCQSQADQRGIRVPVYEGQKFVARAREWRTTKLVLGAIAGMVAVLIGAYTWYVFSGSKPRTLFSLKTTRSDRPVQTFLVAPDQMLLLRAGRLALVNAANGKETWTMTLPAAAPPPASASAKGTASLFADNDFDAPPSRFQVSADDVWVYAGDRVLRLEWATGKKKGEVPIHDLVREVEFTDASIMVIAEDPARQKSITHIALPSGTAKTEAPSVPTPGRTGGGRLASRSALPPRAPAGQSRPDGDELPDYSPDTKEFLPAGANVIQFKSTLLEKRLVPVQAMKAAPAQTKLNSGNLSARDSMKAVREELNEMQRERTGGVTYENESRYQVSLRRLAPSDAPEWMGEGSGPPMLFPQKTVDVLVAGKTVHVFSKKNQKLWEGKLSFPVGEEIVNGYGGENALAPCLEEAGSLFVFDKGVLTDFDVRTGNVAWRVPSVGISQVLRDSSGKLYVATTSASPESIQYSQEVRIDDRPYPVIMKVDAATGRVLWKADHLGDRIYLSGKYVYVTEGRVSGLDVMRAGGDDSTAPVHHRIYRLNPGNGEYIWRYYEPRAPGHISVQKNRLLLQYGDEIQVLSYLTL